MNPQTKSFLLGFSAGFIVMLTLALIWNLSIPHTEKSINETNKTSVLEPIKEIIKEPMKNPFEGITMPDITRYIGKLLIYLLILFLGFFYFFNSNTKNR